MATKLSSALYEAEMFGDKASADAIRAEITRLSTPVQKPKEHVISFNTVLNDEKSSAISVHDFLERSFGSDWFDWEIETLDHMLWTKFSIALEGPNRDKVLAIRHLCGSLGPFVDWYEFNQAALAFAGAMADFEFLKEPSPGMVVNAVKTLMHIRPDLGTELGSPVVKFICTILKSNGIYAPPPTLSKLISEEFKGMISKELVEMWPQILEKYSKIVSSKDSNIEESIVDIQARRIFSAEASAIYYGTKRTE